MPQNATLPATIAKAATPAERERGPLTSIQIKALLALVRGSTVTEAAHDVGVNRTTIHRWLRDDPHFIAEYNAARAEVVAAVRADLAQLGQDAVDVLRKTLISPMYPELKVRAALMVLKMIGADQPAAIGKTDPEAVQLNLRHATSERQIDAMKLEKTEASIRSHRERKQFTSGIGARRADDSDDWERGGRPS